MLYIDIYTITDTYHTVYTLYYIISLYPHQIPHLFKSHSRLIRLMFSGPWPTELRRPTHHAVAAGRICTGCWSPWDLDMTWTTGCWKARNTRHQCGIIMISWENWCTHWENWWCFTNIMWTVIESLRILII